MVRNVAYLDLLAEDDLDFARVLLLDDGLDVVVDGVEHLFGELALPSASVRLAQWLCWGLTGQT